MEVFTPDCRPGVDAQPAIQASIDMAAEAGGGVVLAPMGNWHLGSTVQLKDHVTLRGAGLFNTNLILDSAATGPIVAIRGAVQARGSVGWTMEKLTLQGGTDTAFASGASEGILVPAGVSYGFLRQVMIKDVAGDAIVLAGAPLDHLFIEEVIVERCGGHGIVLKPDGPSAAVFISEIVIRDFGRAKATRAGLCSGLWLEGRCHLSQLHIEPVDEGHAGILFGKGSDHTVLSNLYTGTRGGVPYKTGEDVLGIAVSAESCKTIELP